ncbi:MAG: NAD-dependent DNA ligase LigA [Bacteriovoracaceae bacterium]|jgi:DNA ligase (NAD+)|nr:NAD-dependent DNA ligase LigA [Bacteriovoracaceae bacterium]
MSNRISVLESEILKHKELYYKGAPEISDVEYDALEDELKSLDPQSYALSIVGSTVFSSDKIAHDSKMLSLNKTYDVNDLVRWQDDNELVATYKIDGSSCSIIYENEKIHIAKTRGDGKFGENITNKILHIEHIPKKIEGYTSKIEIRGEVYCTEENFEILSNKMIELGLDKPTSLRNIVAGLLGRKENISLAKYLSFQAFECISDEDYFSSEEEKFNFLKKIGFVIPEHAKVKSRQQVEAFLNKSQSFMEDGDYLIDGIVFTINNIDLHKEMGATAHHPRYKMAFKFQGETKDSIINSISWQVSRNGILTPVANIEPVELSGAVVSRVTLHNFGVVETNELKAGDKIKIVRSGEVIPKFLRVVEASKEEFSYPSKCPSCDTKISKVDIRLICENKLCPARVKDEILNFIQKIGIEDLSSKRIDELLNNKLITKIDDLYDLSKEQLMDLDKVKDKLATKIIDNIQSSKNVDLITFMSSLGIAGGAYNKCEKIVLSGIDSIEKFKDLTVEKLQNIESFAEKSSTDFLSSFKSKMPLVDSLMSKGFSFSAKKAASDSSIAGLKFCITGSLSMKRSELQKLIKSNSGVAVSSVSKATDYLITNDTQSSSSKFKKAIELGIPIINEDKFMELING